MRGGVSVNCKYTLQDMVPFVALEKLKTEIDIKTATPEDMLSRFSELVWDFEAAYHNISEHQGFKWEND